MLRMYSCYVRYYFNECSKLYAYDETKLQDQTNLVYTLRAATVLFAQICGATHKLYALAEDKHHIVKLLLVCCTRCVLSERFIMFVVFYFSARRTFLYLCI